MPRQLHMNLNILNAGLAGSVWRHSDGDPLAAFDVDHYVRAARVAERGFFDAIFLADTPTLKDSPERRPWRALEPTVFAGTIAAPTRNAGLIVTISTSFNDPYNIARRFATLDIASRGRIGINLVTTADDEAARNFGLAPSHSHTERYARAGEFAADLMFSGAHIPFAIAPDYGAADVTDHAPPMIPSLHRRMQDYDARARRYAKNWQVDSPKPLARSNRATAGVVGVGRIGESVIKQLTSFDFRILSFDPGQPQGHEKAVNDELDEQLEDLIVQIDVITLHRPAITETRNLPGTEGPARIKPGAILVNAARRVDTRSHAPVSPPQRQAARCRHQHAGTRAARSVSTGAREPAGWTSDHQAARCLLVRSCGGRDAAHAAQATQILLQDGYQRNRVAI